MPKSWSSFFFSLFEILASFLICEMLPICCLLMLLSVASPVRIIEYLYELCWNKIGMQLHIFSKCEPPHHFEPLLEASVVFSGRMFLSSFLLNCKLLEYRNCFYFPHVCIHCSASLYLVHNKLLSSSQWTEYRYTDWNIWTFGWRVTFNMNPAPNCVLFYFHELVE